MELASTKDKAASDSVTQKDHLINNRHPWLSRATAGVTGGLLGAGVMALLQVVLRPFLRRKCTPGFLADSGIGFQAGYRMPEPASLTAQRLLSRPSGTADHSMASALIVHGTFGSLAGVFYASFPRRLARKRWTALTFGTGLWLGATECVLPILSLSRIPPYSSITIQIFGLAEHLLYALAVEQVCRMALGTGGNGLQLR